MTICYVHIVESWSEFGLVSSRVLVNLIFDKILILLHSWTTIDQVLIVAVRRMNGSELGQAFDYRVILGTSRQNQLRQ